MLQRKDGKQAQSQLRSRSLLPTSSSSCVTMLSTRSKTSKAQKLGNLNKDELKEFYALRSAKAKATRALNKQKQINVVPAAETSGEFKWTSPSTQY